MYYKSVLVNLTCEVTSADELCAVQGGRLPIPFCGCAPGTLLARCMTWTPYTGAHSGLSGERGHKHHQQLLGQLNYWSVWGYPGKKKKSGYRNQSTGITNLVLPCCTTFRKYSRPKTGPLINFLKWIRKQVCKFRSKFSLKVVGENLQLWSGAAY